MTTVGELIDAGHDVVWMCQWCDGWGPVDLALIVAEKGRDFSMIDRLPLCVQGDCRGMLRFRVGHGMRWSWLMTSAGDARFSAHTGWLFQRDMIEIRRATQIETRAKRKTSGRP